MSASWKRCDTAGWKPALRLLFARCLSPWLVPPPAAFSLWPFVELHILRRDVATNRSMKIFNATLLLLVSFSACGAELPALVLPAGVGVNIHFTTGHTKDLDLIAAAGFRFIRMDFGWGGTERKKGEYDWSAYDELTANLEKRGLRAIYILDYSNGLYEETAVTRNAINHKEERDTASPQHPESVAAFARWAAAAARHFHGRHIIWEIWNEPNIFFWKPKPDADQYSTLALATCKAIRAAEPEATIVGPATSELPWKYLETVFQSGLLAQFDAVSVHPYRGRGKPPETAAEDLKKLRELIERYAPTKAKKAMPILSGEWGYSSNTKGVSLETQAAFIVRQQLSNLLNGIPISIWYDWKNDGPDPGENEHNFGTVMSDLRPKPAYIALRTMTRELAGCQIVRRLDLGNEKDYVLLLRNSEGTEKLAAWTLGDAHAQTLGVKAGRGAKPIGVRGNGASFEPTLEGNQLFVDLAAEPIYITLQKLSLAD